MYNIPDDLLTRHIRDGQYKALTQYRPLPAVIKVKKTPPTKEVMQQDEKELRRNLKAKNLRRKILAKAWRLRQKREEAKDAKKLARDIRLHREQKKREQQKQAFLDRYCEIAYDYMDGMRLSALARKYGLSIQHTSQILSNMDQRFLKGMFVMMGVEVQNDRSIPLPDWRKCLYGSRQHMHHQHRDYEEWKRIMKAKAK